jgi:hypothetical protein
VPGYRGRQRSPPRIYSPRRDLHARSPPPRPRRYSRSPVNGGIRPRSPIPVKRGREPSPYDDRQAQPAQYGKRERYASPPREREREREREKFERRGYSPPRGEGQRFSREHNYRPTARDRTRSPVRRSEHVSRMGSPVSSHRSSPHLHPDRAVMSGSGPHSPGIRHPRSVPTQQSPVHRDRSPPRWGYISPVPMSPPEETLPYRQRSPPRRRESPPPLERNEFRNGSTPNTWSKDQMAAHQGLAYHNGDSRGPPSGPSRGHHNGSYPRDSPSGPPAAPISMSAHNRPSGASLLSAPTRPRAGPTFGRDGRGDSPYNGPPPRRGHPQQSPFHGPPSRQQNYDHGPPHGHRNEPPPHHSSRPPPFEHRPPFRTNNSSSTTYPRTQRFSTHLSGIPSIVPGGKLAPSVMDPTAEKRLQQLEEDKKRLLEAIEEKQKGKRAGLRDWERAERESTRDGLKSELAEEALEKMQGDGVGSANAF